MQDFVKQALAADADIERPGALNAATAMQSGVSALAAHPLIGRPIDREIRELVISFGKSGYIAL